MTWVDEISEKCIQCRLCQEECEFLKGYGKPKNIAAAYDPAHKKCRGVPYECSLCELCESVCPVNLSPAHMFLEMRRESVLKGCGVYPHHAMILNYERLGTSRFLTHYALPEGCDTVFFPGCALSGTRPDRVFKLYEHMKQSSPALGIVLDCCTKPSHDLGRESHFDAMFGEMKAYLDKSGVKTVLTACPSCYKVFKDYGGGLRVRTIYDALLENGPLSLERLSATVTVHDPCAVRFDLGVHVAVRALIEGMGITVEEMSHHGEKTLCCGEGGAVSFFSPKLAESWSALRKNEAGGRRILTYCAGCVGFLGSATPTSHLIDLLFDPEATLDGRVKVSKSPFTYWNRIRLKSRFKKNVSGAVTRERTFNPGKGSRR